MLVHVISNRPCASRLSDFEITRNRSLNCTTRGPVTITHIQYIKLSFCSQLEGMELKLQHFHTDLADNTQWMSDTETLLKSPAFNLDDENITSDKVAQQNELVEVTFQFCRILGRELLNGRTNELTKE